MIERALLVSGQRASIDLEDLALPAALIQPLAEVRSDCCELSFEREPTLEEIKARYLGYLIQRHRGHRGRIAGILGVSERNTYRMVKKFGLEDK